MGAFPNISQVVAYQEAYRLLLGPVAGVDPETGVEKGTTTRLNGLRLTADEKPIYVDGTERPNIRVCNGAAARSMSSERISAEGMANIFNLGIAALTRASSRGTGRVVDTVGGLPMTMR